MRHDNHNMAYNKRIAGSRSTKAQFMFAGG
jgi:hypothetical protein